MNDEQEIQEEAGLGSNWKIKDAAPIMTQRPPMSTGVQPGPGNYFAGPTDPTLQHDSDATKSKTAGGAIPEYSLMPTGAANAPNNAAIKSVITQTLGEITKTVASSTAAAFTPCTKVNYQTTGDYTVQLSDLAGIISIGNSAGGVITLPSPTSGAAPGTLVQAAYGSGSASLTNTSGNGMIAVVFTSPNVTLGTVSVTDSAGNVWIPITTNSGDSELMCTFYCAKVPGGHNTVTAVVPFFPPPPPPSQVPFFTFIAVYEVAGLVPNGLDQFANGVGSGNASISPTTSSTVAFTFAQATSLTPTNPTPGSGWTGVTPPLPILGWNYPAYAGGMLGGYWVGLAEYILNPAKGVAISGTASGGAIADSDVTMANFAIAPNASAAGFTSCWYTWIENTGTGSYYLESASTIDGSVDSVLIGPNEGLMVVYDGTNWVTERGLGGGATGVTELNSLTGAVNITAGTGITIATSPGTVEISATSESETAQTIWSWPGGNTTSSANANPVSGSIMNFVANQVNFFYVNIDKPIQVGKFSFLVASSDTHHYDWGMYDLSGTLIWNLGATIFNSTGLIETPLAQGTVTIQPGNYWLAFTGDGTGIFFQGVTSSQVSPAMFFANSKTGTPAWWTSSTVSTGGTLTGLSPVVPSAPTTASNLTNGIINSFSGQGIMPIISLTT
jgi:hypothetical protein